MLSLALITVAVLGALWQSPMPDPLKPTGDSVLTWLRYPIERNPHLRLPIIDSQLNSITFTADGRTGWAVGSGGTILKSEDGGQTWTPRVSDASAQLASVTFTSDGITGWAVGDDGIFKSEDGGQTWAPRPSGTTARLTAVTFTSDGTTGWVVGGDGTILKSEDSGQTWAPRPSGTTAWLASVTFTEDGTTGWIVGWNGTILKSEDGGQTWTPRPSGTRTELASVTFTEDGTTGWVVGWDGTILKSEDGGQTWTPRAGGTPRLTSVTFTSDGTTGWAVGDGGTILKSEDSGQTWTPRPSGTTAWLQSVTFTSDGTTGWAVGDGGTILKSEDSGQTWTPRTSGTAVWLQSVTFTEDGTTGWAVGWDGTVLKSEDSGQTWTPRTSSTTSRLESVTFTGDGRTGWAVGHGGTILKSEDSGETWTPRTSSTAAWLESVTFARDGRTGWAVGRGGTILKSEDSGETWTLRISGTTSSLGSVTFAGDGRTGWAVGHGGTILKSEDSGETWTSCTSNTTAQLESATFAEDGTTGWAVGSGGTILKSEDGGETWTSRSRGTTSLLTSVAVTEDGTTGWVVGWNGALLNSEDGGETWTSRSRGTTSLLTSVTDRVSIGSRALLESATFMSDGARGWIVGRDVILLATNGGGTWRPLTPDDDYRRYPAPWTWLALVCALLALLPAARQLPASQVEGIEDTFVSDQPLAFPEQDVLERGYIYRGLSRFLRNENTEPPLTIAIIGDWGQGKSSLMRLLQADMTHYGTSAVWFNAWHHQKERHLFAALLRAVRDQAIPRLMTSSGVRFRWRLFWSRVHRHWILTLIVLVTFVAWIKKWWPDEINLPDQNFVETFADLIIDKLDLKQVGKEFLLSAEYYFDPIISFVKDRIPPFIFDVLPYTPFLCVVIIAFLFPIRLRRWKFNPDRLMSNVSKGTLRIREFSPQLGFRQRFGDAFEEVAKVLRGKPLLVVIDDLDRCRPEQVVETLEAVNFLVHAGDCYVVMGIAKEQVLSCVGLGFKDIAEEMGNAQGDGKARRREYAQNYLDKLINLEVVIPRLDDAGANDLVSSDHRDHWREKLERLRKFLKTLTIWMMILGSSIYVAYVIIPGSDRSVPSSPSELPAPTGQTEARPALVPETREPTEPRDGSSSDFSFRSGADLSVPWWSVFLAIMVLGTLFLVVGYHVLQRYQDRPQGLPNPMKALGAVLDAVRLTQSRVQDSPAFTKALNIWLSLVREIANSPRQVKRFINRVRYLAMISSSEEDPGQVRISAPALVALAALQSFNEEFLVDKYEERLLKLICPPVNEIYTPAKFKDKSGQSVFVALAALRSFSEESLADKREEARQIKDYFDQSTKDWIEALRKIGADIFADMDDDRAEQIVRILSRAFIDHHAAFPDAFAKEEKARELISRFRKIASGIVVR